MQCNAMLSLPFGVGKKSSWVRVYRWLQRERERKRDSFGKRKSLSKSYESLFSFFFPRCVFSAETHTHECLEGLSLKEAISMQ